MKRIGFVLCLLLASVAVADGKPDYTSYSSALTGTAPTLGTQGIDLANVAGYRVIVSAESTRTLSGAGTLQCYYWSNPLARWIRCLTTFDIAVDSSSVRDHIEGDFTVAVGAGRIFYKPDSVTVSAGTTVTVTIEVVRK